jgi:hydroxymethylpyrimidine/phosphomethylpyrimidine kinase
MLEAVKDAQDYTWQTLKAGFRAGMGQYIPDRLFWAREEDKSESIVSLNKQTQ